MKKNIFLVGSDYVFPRTANKEIKAYAAGQPLRAYRPQRDFLSLLNLGDGRAVEVRLGPGRRRRGAPD